MQNDSVKLIRDAEQRARQTIADARRDAAELVKKAHSDSRRYNEDTMAAARTAAADTIETARADGRKRAEKDRSRYLDQGQQLQKKAADRREKAVEAVLDAIVNG